MTETNHCVHQTRLGENSSSTSDDEREEEREEEEKDAEEEEAMATEAKLMYGNPFAAAAPQTAETEWVVCPS